MVCARSVHRLCRAWRCYCSMAWRTPSAPSWRSLRGVVCQSSAPKQRNYAGSHSASGWPPIFGIITKIGGWTMMRKQAMTFSLLAALLGSPLVAQEPTATPAGEVAAPRRLSPEEVAAAIAAGQRAAKRQTLCFSTQARSAIVAGPVFAYDMVIMSAYSRVALRAFRSKTDLPRCNTRQSLGRRLGFLNYYR